MKKELMRLFAFMLMFGLLIGSAGCVYVTLHAKINKQYAKNQYNNIVVICTDEDSDIATATEDKVGEYLKQSKMDWVKYFPFSDNYYEGSNTKKSSFQKKLTQFISENNADGILFISDNGLRLSSYIEGMTTYRGGYTSVDTEDVKSVRLRMELYDARTRESIWYSKGGASSASILKGQQDLINSFVHDSMDKLSYTTGLLDEKVTP